MPRWQNHGQWSCKYWLCWRAFPHFMACVEASKVGQKCSLIFVATTWQVCQNFPIYFLVRNRIHWQFLGKSSYKVNTVYILSLEEILFHPSMSHHLVTKQAYKYNFCIFINSCCISLCCRLSWHSLQVLGKASAVNKDWLVNKGKLVAVVDNQMLKCWFLQCAKHSHYPYLFTTKEANKNRLW